MRSRRTVRITIAGDERLKVKQPAFLELSLDESVVWGDVKQRVQKMCSLKPGWTSSSYALYDWRVHDENGDELVEDTPITEDVTVYARSNYTGFKWDGNAIVGYSGQEPRGKIIIPIKTKEIRQGAFAECTQITDVSLRGCSELRKVEWEVLSLSDILKDIKKTKTLKNYSHSYWITMLHLST